MLVKSPIIRQITLPDKDAIYTALHNVYKTLSQSSSPATYYTALSSLKDIRKSFQKDITVLNTEINRINVLLTHLWENQTTRYEFQTIHDNYRDIYENLKLLKLKISAIISTSPVRYSQLIADILKDNYIIVEPFKLQDNIPSKLTLKRFPLKVETKDDTNEYPVEFSENLESKTAISV